MVAVPNEPNTRLSEKKTLSMNSAEGQRAEGQVQALEAQGGKGDERPRPRPARPKAARMAHSSPSAPHLTMAKAPRPAKVIGTARPGRRSR